MTPWTEALGWTLLHFIWQGGVLASVLAVFLFAARRASPPIRYAVSCATLLAMVLCVVTTMTLVAKGRGQSLRDAVPLVGGLNLILGDTALGTSIPWIVVCWSVGVALLSTRLAGGIAINQGLVRDAHSGEHTGCEQLLRRLCDELGVNSAVRLVRSKHTSVPMVIGWLRPVIFFPASALVGLTSEQLELLLRHEIAHIRRHDYLVNVLQGVVEALLFYHPAVWWVSRQIRVEREYCCDDIAVGHANPVAYLQALATLEWARPRNRALSLGADGGSLVARARRLAMRGMQYEASGQRYALRRNTVSVLLTIPIALALAAATSVITTTSTTTADQLENPSALLPQIAAPGFSHCATRSDSLSVCPVLVEQSTSALSAVGGDGFVVIQDVRTGALVAYAAGSNAEREVTTASPPASVLKLAVAAIWWEHGLPDAVGCPMSMLVGERRITNPGLADVDAVRSPEDMLVHSCNTAAVQMALRLRSKLGAEGLLASLEMLGFVQGVANGRASDAQGSDESFWGPAPSTWRHRLTPAVTNINSIESDTAVADLALGTVGVRVSPLHLSRFLQAVGADGVMHRPTLTRRKDVDAGTRVMSSGTARRLQHAMLAVVARGTAMDGGSLLGDARWHLGGKTGTLRGKPGRSDDGWFAGLMFDELGAARYTVVAFVRGAGSGGQGATRVAARLTRFMGGSGLMVASR